MDDPESTSGTNTVTMTGNKTVTAVFVQQYTVTVTIVGDGGDGTVTPNGGTFDAGSVRSFNATRLNHYAPRFHHWEGLPEDQFPEGLAGPGSSDDNPVTVTINGDYSFVAIYEEAEVDLTVLAQGPGTVSPGSGTHFVGDTVTLTATPDQDARFVAWYGEGTDDSGAAIYGNTNPSITITLNTSRSLMAQFAPNGEFVLAVEVLNGVNAQGTVTASPQKEFYESGEEVTLTASPVEDFSCWTGDLNANYPTETLVMNGDKSVIAYFVDPAEAGGGSGGGGSGGGGGGGGGGSPGDPPPGSDPGGAPGGGGFPPSGDPPGQPFNYSFWFRARWLSSNTALPDSPYDYGYARGVGTGAVNGERCGRTWWFTGHQESGSYTVDMEVESPDAPCSYSPSPSSAPETANASVILFNHWLFGDGSTSTDYTATEVMDSSQPTAGATAYFATHHLVLDTDLGRDYLLPGESLDDHVTFEFSPPLPSNASVGTASMTTISSTAAGETVRVAFAIEAGARTKFVQGTITVPFLPQDLVNVRVDSNGDLILDEADDQIEETEPFRFWVNNDADTVALGFDDNMWDASDSVINGIKDLEDFATMIVTISPLDPQVWEDLALEMEFIPDSGAPEMRLFEKLEPGNTYLTTPAVAEAYFANGNDAEWTYAENATVPLPMGDFEIGIPKQILFEGCSPGTGTLVVRATVGGVVVSSDSVRIHFADFLNGNPELYSVADFWGPGGSGGWQYNNWNPTRPSTTLFIHGFNVPSANAYREWFPTIYKRLYWAGHTGNFIGVTWDGKTFLWEDFVDFYNDAVFKSLEAGPQVANFITQKLSGRIDIMAHSQGNGVAGEACTHLAPGQVTNYILCEAAVTANAYHSGAPRDVRAPLTNPNGLYIPDSTLREV